ncbi:MAG: alanine--tRNA ligase, partial [Thermoanaerobaculia bacterium]|nr:alanine--tRNA ligase [Thermoanaerobaculia bacterium]
LAGRAYGDGETADVSLRVIADHVRAVGFLLADGVIPANDGRGYVLRRILRRAVRHGLRLGLEEPFLHRLLPTLAEVMDSYPELEATRPASTATVLAEEEKFLSTVAAGARHVQEAVDLARSEGRDALRGEEVFRLYDTFGLPVEMIREILEEEALSLDEVGFERALAEQRERSRSAASRTQSDLGSLRRTVLAGGDLAATEFLGYDRLELDGATLVRAARREEAGFTVVDRLDAGERGVAIVDRTVFYAESGGQVADTGSLIGASGRAAVVDVQKDGGVYLLWVEVASGTLEVGETVAQEVDADRRRRTERNHTATHLLHAALRAELGTQVRQAGSLVHPDRLRFDYTFDRPLDGREREEIEDQVRRWVRKAVPTEIVEKPYDEAIAEGAMALFGEKYGDVVRTVAVPGFSVELCGGCHVSNTGEIGGFRIMAERGVASGVRRIEAVSGEAAAALDRADHQLVARVSDELGVPPDRVVDEIGALKSRLRESEKELQRLRMRQVTGGGADEGEEVTVAGVRVVSKEIEGAPFGELRTMADVLRQRLGSGVVVIGTRSDDRVSVVVTVTEDLTERLDAGTLARRMGALVGGSGGGRSDFAQAGGKDPARLASALAAVPGEVGEL